MAAPAYTLVPVGGKFSYRFQSTCAGCHGPSGAGRAGYPTIPGKLSLAEFRTTVRQGKGTNMPAFDATAISDADIDSDYNSLSQGVAVGNAMAMGGRTHPDTWTAEKRDQVLSRGLEVLRKPDKFGTACANCHSPDAIELGVIAFTDDDVLRRGLQHVSPEDALDLVDYVHALRAKYNIKEPCTKLWRPLQPGGEPLPGDTTEAREVAFAQELEKRNLLIYTKPISSLDEAKAAADELVAVSLRTLPVGVKFPRWSEDAFDGAEHRSFNDWMPGAGRVPKNPTSWYAMHDQYLADPTIQNIAAIDAALKAETAISRADSHGREISANFSTTYDAQGWMEQVLLVKHQSVLLGAHLFRMALLGKPGWYERGALLFPELSRAYGSYFHQGLLNAESPCYSNQQCDTEVVARLPAFMKDEFDPGQTVTSTAMDILSDPWSYLGQLFDHSLLTAENTRGPTQDGHYWNEFTFEHRFLQQPLFSAHRLITQETFATKYRGTDKYPASLEQASHQARPPGVDSGLGQLPKAVHPILHGDWTDVQGLDAPRTEDTDTRLGPSTFLRANVALMFAYLQRDLLQKGEPVAAKQLLLSRFDHFRSPAQQLATLLNSSAWTAKNPRNVESAAVLVTDALKLIDEVENLVKAAPETKDPWEP